MVLTKITLLVLILGDVVLEKLPLCITIAKLLLVIFKIKIHNETLTESAENWICTGNGHKNKAIYFLVPRKGFLNGLFLPSGDVTNVLCKKVQLKAFLQNCSYVLYYAK